jgi:hypothetical protein
MIEAGELPEPAPGAGMDAWLEQCRQAGAGEFRLTLGHRPAPERQVETTAEFLARLARVRAEADAAQGIAPEPPPAPAKPISLADELRAMGLM